MREMHHGTREFLDTVFRKMSVEKILYNIRFCGSWNNLEVHSTVCNNMMELIEMYGTGDVLRYTNDERKIWREIYLPFLSKVTKAASIFDVLFDYAGYVLDVQNGIPVCKIKQVLNWNSIYSRLGQDIFTTAMICKNDLQHGAEAKFFEWEAVIKTDDGRLNAILSKGLAENHYHLNGSTQSFDLTWICLMNHVSAIQRLDFIKELGKETTLRTVIGNYEKTMSLKRKVMYAARIRSLLFQKILGIIKSKDVNEKFEEFYDFYRVEDCKYEINALRMLAGERFLQPDHPARCLDYCITKWSYEVDASSCNRALGGERNFLYSCLREVRLGTFDEQEISLFYVYIILKNQFREGLIQINNILGFDNFSGYQDKKSSVYEKFLEYWVEAQRLGICATIEDNNVQLLETRIMPKGKAEDLVKSVYLYDKYVTFSSNEEKELSYFYVCHFPKRPEMDAKVSYNIKPRNSISRENARKMTFALKEFYRLYSGCSRRVFGIDACSHEIGCRPEVFATEFRCLRKLNMYSSVNNMKMPEYEFNSTCAGKKNSGFSVTYHVGEDFLGLCDGLRAIDEAINFLGLKRGERIGHALALGTDAAKYYELKRWTIHIRKQDLLDNYVWVLYKTIEWGIELSPEFRENLRTRAKMLLLEIYGGRFSLNANSSKKTVDNDGYSNDYELVNYCDLDNYYHSWKLRGDYPELYGTGEYQRYSHLSLDADYVNSMEQPGRNFEVLRGDRKVTFLVYLYHYDAQAKKIGAEPDLYDVCTEYVDLMTKIQDKMIHMIAEKGIAIECNPTSNIRIGPFMQYENHPITRFNDYHLNLVSKTPQIMVSINTDDLGVFNTSLSHEYALLLESLRRQRHRDGNYNDEELYDYLDYIRENGIRMSFANG